MNPFEFARFAFDTRHWNSDDFGENDCSLLQAIAGAIGLVLFMTVYISTIIQVSPMLGGGAWYVATVSTLPAILLLFAVVVPILSDRPSWMYMVLGLVIGPGSLAFWMPWLVLWLIWRVVQWFRIIEAHSAWRAYWAARRVQRETGIPTASARERTS